MTDIETSVSSISVSKLQKNHRDIGILHSVGFTAVSGEVTAFLRSNGTGESSTLGILLDLGRVDSGSALSRDKRYHDIDRSLTHMGTLLDGLMGDRIHPTVLHLAVVAKNNGIPRVQVSQALEQTGLSAKRKSRLNALSLDGGQRLGLAVVLLDGSQFLVLDEPTNDLNPVEIHWLRDLVREQAALGRTVPLPSHVLSGVQAVTDCAVVISEGNVLFDSPLAGAMEKISSLENLFFGLTEGVA